MSPRRKPRVFVGDWRTDDERAADQRLTGTWWRCRAHGVTCDPVVLGGFAYCPETDCSERAVIVHRVSEDRPSDAPNWNAYTGPKRPRKEAMTEPEPATETPPASAPEPAAPPTARRIVLETLGKSPDPGVAVLRAVLKAAIAKRLPDLSPNVVDATLMELIRKGVVKRSGFTRGAYMLAGETETAPPEAMTKTNDREDAAPSADAPAAKPGDYWDPPRTFSTATTARRPPSDPRIASFVLARPDTFPFMVELTKPQYGALTALLDSGYYGATEREVLERILSPALQDAYMNEVERLQVQAARK